MKILPLVSNVYRKWNGLESLERGAIAASVGVMLLAGAAITKNNHHNNNHIAKYEEYVNTQADYNKASLAIDDSDSLNTQENIK